VRVPYRSRRAPSPVRSLGPAQLRYRPICAVRITGPGGNALRDGLLDSGAEDTVFPESVAPLIGLDLSQAPQYTVGLAGRGPMVCRFAQVTLWLTDGVSQAFEWETIVAFVPVMPFMPLLGQAGTLEYFDVTLRGADREMEILPNRNFAGRQI
jgi:hypothetical protein